MSYGSEGKNETNGWFTSKHADKYRTQHGLLTSEEIRARRNQLGMTQEAFARYLNVGIASVKARESAGQIELTRLKSDLARANKTLPRFCSARAAKPTSSRTSEPSALRSLDRWSCFFSTKAAEGSTGLGPLHVNKLCWYADAENYRHYQVSITGARYARLPAARSLTIIDRSFANWSNGALSSKRPTDRFEAMQAFRPEELSCGELETLATLWDRFKGKLARVVNQSQRERRHGSLPAREAHFLQVHRATGRSVMNS